MNAQPTPYVQEISEANFQDDVLQRSTQTPVVVDFWAPWCGPCQVIGPVLEKLAAEYDGRFYLAKVNVEENQQLAAMMQIQSIPAIKLFKGGELVDEFMGALPEADVRRFLNQHLPSLADVGAEDALDLWIEGKKTEAVAIFESVLEEDAQNPAALIGMALHAFDGGDLEKAKDTASLVNEVALEKRAQHPQLERMLNMLKAQIELHAIVNEANPSHEALDKIYRQACTNALAGDFDAALEALLNMVKSNRTFRKDGARRMMVTMFGMMPPQDPRIYAWRGKLSSVLFR